MGNDDCIFCKIARGEIPCHKIWEDESHMAFLSIFPNTEGFSVVIPKKHYPSYVFNLSDKVLFDLVSAAKKVGKLIDLGFNDVGRTGMIAEGFGVNHAHIKLFPMHGTTGEKWKEIKSTSKKFFPKYEGFIASNDSQRADDEKLKEIAERIRKTD